MGTAILSVTALSPSNSINALRWIVEVDNAKDHVLLGTDFPNNPWEGIEFMTTQLEGTKELDVEGLRQNGLKLFPGLSK